MNYSYRNWPFRWFGIWKEYGIKYTNYPAIQMFVDPSINCIYEKQMLIEYLNRGIIVATTSRINFPSPFDGKISPGSISFRTDGNYMWLDNISELINYNNLIIPEKWHNEMKMKHFIMPEVSESQLENVEWPSLG